jgi:ankyrin repeat protein
VEKKENRNHNHHSETVLIMATKIGAYRLAMQTISAGASLNVQDEKGNTALHYAVEGGTSAIARTLVFQGVEIKVKNRQGNTPGKK